MNISSKPLKAIVFLLSDEAKKLMIDIKLLDYWLENAQLVYKN